MGTSANNGDSSSSGGVNIFELCVQQQLENSSSGGGTSNSLLLKCMSDLLQKQHEEEVELIESHAKSNRDNIVLLMAALVFFMQAGFAMVCAGAVRRKNLQNTMLKNMLDACGATIAFWAVGYAIAFGSEASSEVEDEEDFQNTLMGTSNFFLRNVADSEIVFWVFQYTFSAASATIVAGSLAERCQMTAYFYYSVMLTGWVYPIIVHAVWSTHGFLSPISQKPLFGVGMLDCAGGGVVHVTGGFTALIAAWVSKTSVCGKKI